MGYIHLVRLWLEKSKLHLSRIPYYPSMAIQGICLPSRTWIYRLLLKTRSTLESTVQRGGTSRLRSLELIDLKSENFN